jgi:hypothetical protein
MQAILKEPGMPAWTTVHDWKQADESFRQALARAREQQAEVWAEEMLSISDDDLPTHEAIGRARLRVQSRQWLAGKYNPQFADKPNLRRVTVWRRVGILLNVAGDKESFFRPLLARGGDSESVADFGLPSYACEGLLERGQGFGTGSLSRAASALQLA